MYHRPFFIYKQRLVFSMNKNSLDKAFNKITKALLT